MNNRRLRKLVYEILKCKKTELYLFDFINYVRNDADIDQITEFFEQYNKRYSNELFQISKLGSLKTKYELSADLFKEIQNLESGDFEKLSAKICEYFGFNKEFYATKHSYDEGIDFIAYKEVDHVRFDFREYAFGQSKKFKEKLVETSEIRELAGAVALFKMREFSTLGGVYERHEIKSYTPIHVYFITNYFFSEPSENLCKSTSIISLDILDILYILIEGINHEDLIWKNSDGRFNKRNFKKDLERIKIEY